MGVGGGGEWVVFLGVYGPTCYHRWIAAWAAASELPLHHTVEPHAEAFDLASWNQYRGTVKADSMPNMTVMDWTAADAPATAAAAKQHILEKMAGEKYAGLKAPSR